MATGKRLLSAAGKWVLTSTGKADICQACCCNCCGCYYSVTFNSTTLPDCICVDLAALIDAYYLGLGTQIVDLAGCTVGGEYGDAAPACSCTWAFAAVLWANGDCPIEGTADYVITATCDPDTCLGTVNATITKGCCVGCPTSCGGKCYLITHNSVTVPACVCSEVEAAIQTALISDPIAPWGGVAHQILSDCTFGEGPSDNIYACDTFWNWTVTWWKSGMCPTLGTQDVIVDIYSQDDPEVHCDATLNITIEEVPCCPCPDACWRWTITAVPAYTGDCIDCMYANAGAVFAPGFPWYTCIPFCPYTDESDFGFPVSYCYQTDGTILLRASLEQAPPCVDEACCPFYIKYSRATPIPTDANGCPVDGTYLLDLDPSHDGLPCNIPQINVKIEQLNCCTDATPQASVFLSCDIVYTDHTDVDGDMTDCDGNGGGGNTVEVCNTTVSLADLELAWGTVCSWGNVDVLPCYYPKLYLDTIYIANVAGDWHLIFGDYGAPPTSIKIGGLTPVGVYPDIDVCFNDGFHAYHFVVTNIVITA